MKHMLLDEAWWSSIFGIQSVYWLRQFSVDLCWFVDDTWRLLQIFHFETHNGL